MSKELIEQAKDKFGVIIEEQLKRIEEMKKEVDFIDFSTVNPVTIGVCWGDGIGEIISKHAQYVLTHVLKDEVKNKKIIFKDISGLTIENRAKHKQAIPDDVLEEIKGSNIYDSDLYFQLPDDFDDIQSLMFHYDIREGSLQYRGVFILK